MLDLTTNQTLINELITQVDDLKRVKTTTILKWKCPKNHIYSMEARLRLQRNLGCVYCAGKKVLVGFNDVATTDKEILKYWSENNSIKPTEISRGSKKKIEFICEKGHRYTKELKQFTILKRRCPYCSGLLKKKGYNDLLTLYPEIYEEYSSENDTPVDELWGIRIPEYSKKVKWVCRKNNNHYWETSLLYRIDQELIDACPYCKGNRNRSKPEIELKRFINSISNEKIVFNNRTILNGQELDIYIPSKNIAIEFNGLYWHSEIIQKDKYYHYNKWKKCKDKGIHLITIWEDDWRDNRVKVEQQLKHNLEYTNEPTNSIELIFIDDTYSRIFCNENHINGYIDGEIHTALKYNDEIIAVMVLSKDKDCNSTFHIINYCATKFFYSNFNKLIEFVERNFNIKQIRSIVDHEIINSTLYENAGFIKNYEIEPDYSYVYKNTRISKSDQSLYKTIKTDKLYKIWDAGKDEYTKILGDN